MAVADKKKKTEDTELPPLRVLLVDNDKDHVRAMVESVEKLGLDCTSASSGPEGERLLDENTYEIVVTDLMMNDFDGMEILKKAKEVQPECEVILVTGHATVSRAVEAMREKAFNFLEKPITPKRLQAVVTKAADSMRLKLQNNMLQSRLDERYGFENLIYVSDRMKEVVQRLRRIAPTDAGVLITGETGVGKDVVAQAIHQNSPRKKKPFVAINTAAVAEHLVESELFGHVKGAFTDAISDRVGKFEYANGGTLFLDEIGDMPMPTQIKLLRVLENREITRVGDNKPIKVNVRVLAATNKDLEKEIDEGRFRSDLFFRLNMFSVHIAPLSQRRDDVLPLADFFRRQANKNLNRKVKGFTPELRKWLLDFHWKGNVRQLRNIVESMVVMDLDDLLHIDDLSPDLQSVNAENQTADDKDAGGAFDTSASYLIGKTMKEIEKWATEQTLQMAGNNRKETAAILGISERNLYRLIDKYDLKDKSTN